MASVERESRRALRRLIFYRFLGEVFSFPQFFLRTVAAFATGFSKWFNRLELTVFALEQDAARRYWLLTNFDLGMATGEPGRYAALDPAFAERATALFQREALDEDES